MKRQNVFLSDEGTESKDYLAQIVAQPSQKTAAIVSIGDELLEGQYQNTNAVEISQRLAALAVMIKEQVTLGDDQAMISQALLRLMGQYDLVFISGGLGPTSDDRTRMAVSDAVQRPLIHCEECWQHIIQRMTRFNLTVREGDKEQALIPEGAHLIANTCGHAYGFMVEASGTICIVFPGPPNEMRAMLNRVLPMDQAVVSAKKRKFQWKLMGVTESAVQAFTQGVSVEFSEKIKSLWVHPYLNIAVEVEDADTETKAHVARLDAYLQDRTVSKDGTSASQLIQNLPAACWSSSDPELQRVMGEPMLQEAHFGYAIETIPPLSQAFKDSDYSGSLQILCTVPTGQQHRMVIPLRGPEVVVSIKEYTAWVYWLSQSSD